MKKWNEPQVVELGLQNTEDSDCNADFSSEAVPATPTFIGCNTGGYERKPGSIVCRHYDNGKCKYVAPGGQS